MYDEIPKKYNLEKKMKMVKKLSKKCQKVSKSCPKNVKKLSKSCQKINLKRVGEEGEGGEEEDERDL
jgi:hypothetical protein